LGQFFLGGDSKSWNLARILLTLYLFSALSLLVVTSFLNLRRYLRQRQTEMPLDATIAWLAGGIVIIGLILMIAYIAPLPGKAVASMKAPEFLTNRSPPVNMAGAMKERRSVTRTTLGHPRPARTGRPVAKLNPVQKRAGKKAIAKMDRREVIPAERSKAKDKTLAVINLLAVKRTSHPKISRRLVTRKAQAINNKRTPNRTTNRRKTNLSKTSPLNRRTSHLPIPVHQANQNQKHPTPRMMVRKAANKTPRKRNPTQQTNLNRPRTNPLTNPNKTRTNPNQTTSSPGHNLKTKIKTRISKRNHSLLAPNLHRIVRLRSVACSA